MIILASEQHPTSRRFQFQESSDEPTKEVEQGGGAKHCGEIRVEKVAKENPLSRFVRWVKTRSHKRMYQQPKDSHGAELSAVALAPQPTLPSKACQIAVSAIMDKLVQIISRLRNKKPGEVYSQPSRSLLESIWVYLSDCGGQPQYHELLPLFMHSAHFSCFVCLLPSR